MVEERLGRARAKEGGGDRAAESVGATGRVRNKEIRTREAREIKRGWCADNKISNGSKW